MGKEKIKQYFEDKLIKGFKELTIHEKKDFIDRCIDLYRNEKEVQEGQQQLDLDYER